MVGSSVCPPASSLASLVRCEQLGGLGDRLRAMIVESVHGSPPRPIPPPSWSRDFWAAFQTACGVAGMAMSSWPSASVMALMTAAGAAMAPASPQPLMPSGLDGQGVLVMATLKDGRSLARGMQ